MARRRKGYAENEADIVMITKFCRWTQKNIYGVDMWTTSCGRNHMYVEGFKFCPFCSHRIERPTDHPNNKVNVGLIESKPTEQIVKPRMTEIDRS